MTTAPEEPRTDTSHNVMLERFADEIEAGQERFSIPPATYDITLASIWKRVAERRAEEVDRLRDTLTATEMQLQTSIGKRAFRNFVIWRDKQADARSVVSADPPEEEA